MSSQTNNPLLTAALSYAQRGWAVLPLHCIEPGGNCSCRSKACKSIGKHPASKNGTKDATTDQVKITDWWAKEPRCNVGIATGTASGGLVVVDFDERHGGFDHLTLIAPSGVEVKTGNGLHRYYQGDGTIQNSQNKLAQGVDVRGNGGYVVAPPSSHVSGNRYEWVSDDHLSPFPIAAAYLLQHSQRNVHVSAQVTPADQDEIWVSDTTLLPQDVAGGNRHNFLVSFGGRLHNAGLVGAELDAALQAVNLQRCQPPKPQAEVSKIAHWVDTKPAPPATPAQPKQTQATGNQTQSATAPQAQAQPKPTLADSMQTVGEFLLTIYPDLKPLFYGLYRQSWGVIAAPSNLGKSTLLWNCAISLACGRPFEPFIQQGTKQIKILILDYESRPQGLQEQLARMSSVLTFAEIQEVEKNLHLIMHPQVGDELLFITNKHHMQVLEKFIKDNDFDLVIFDTLSKCSTLRNENDNAEMNRVVVNPIASLAYKTNAAILLVHHSGKGGKYAQTDPSANSIYDQYDSRGGSALIDGAHWALNLRQAKGGGNVLIKNVKVKADSDDEWIQFQRDKETRWFVQMGVMPTSVPSAPAKKVTIGQLILEHVASQPTPSTLNDIDLALINYSRATLAKELQRLRDKGKLTQGRDGSYRLAGDTGDDDDDDAPVP